MSRGIEACPVTAVATTTASTAARTRSATMSTRRLRIRSTQAPAGQADDQERGVLGGGEHAHLPLGRGELLHREDGQRERGQLGAELAEGVARPEPAEVRVVDQRPVGVVGVLTAPSIGN